jgi:predicted O-methyltransferase YrrM
MAPDGLIVVDNVLWGGAVVDDRDQSADTVAIRAFNDAMVGRDDLDVVMVPIADGLSFVTRR